MATQVRISIDDVPMDGMTQAKEGEQKILFVRDADGVRAFAGECPHYGAPLAKGAICGRTLYCPWHKAAFDIGDGRLVEPPALEGLTRYPVTIEGQEAIATLNAMPAKATKDAADGTHVVIVGAGAAAVSAVTTLRREGYAGKITMVGREGGTPYDRPKLSKAFLAKKTPSSAVALEDEFYARHAVDQVVDAATRIEPKGRQVTLAGGKTIVGDALLVATGSRAVTFEKPGHDLGNVFTLRSLGDAVALSDAAESARHVTIVGSGFIGLEAAAFLKTRGLDVDIVTPEALPLSKRFGDDVARALKRYHEGNGIRICQGQVERLTGKGRVKHVELDDGPPIATDLVLVAIGSRPETDVVDGAETRDDGGLIVDDELRLADGCWAAGDIVVFPESRSGTMARIEHWRLAEQQGAHVARAILGATMPFRAAPFFWSNQGEKRLDYAGYAPKWDRIVFHGNVDDLDFIAYYILDGRVLAACAIGQNDRMLAVLHQLTDMEPLSVEEIGPMARNDAG